MNNLIYTIGHSNHPIDVFIALLHRHGVSTIGDVRSHPYSRYVTQYSRDALKSALANAGIAYVFLGKELGARSSNPACYERGKVQYDRLEQEPGFAEGIRRVIQGAKRYRIALMCAEKDPLECHRTLLVARRLSESGVPIAHILGDGSLEIRDALESRLLAVCNLSEGDMFRSREDLIAEAYAIQSGSVAYRNDAMAGKEGH